MCLFCFVSDDIQIGTKPDVCFTNGIVLSVVAALGVTVVLLMIATFVFACLYVRLCSGPKGGHLTSPVVKDRFMIPRVHVNEPFTRDTLY